MAREALKYSTVAGGDPIAAASAAALDTLYASTAALQSEAGVVFIPFADPESGERPVRLNLFLTGVGSDGQAVGGDAYLVFPTALDGEAGVRLQKLGAMSSTLGADAVAAAMGGRENEVWAKAAAFTGVGLQEALSGGALSVKSFPTGTGGAGSPAGYAVYDVGNAVGVAVAPHKGTATSVNLMHERWA